VLEVNALLDKAPAHVTEVEVLAKRVHHSRRGRSYGLTVSSWGPYYSPSHHVVERDFYDSVSEGDSVHIEAHDGALGVFWYRVIP
jgi:hypothetical protein